MDKKTLKLREEQHRDTAQHRDTCEDTNRRVCCMPTRREFYIAIAVFFLLTMSGKLVRGSFWFESKDYTPYVKMRQNAETMEILTGILEDNTNRLDRAKTMNQYRTQSDLYGERHEFKFARWSYPEKAVGFMLRNNSTNCLNWLIRQDGWRSVLSDETVDQVLNYNDKEYVPARIDDNRTRVERRKKRVLLAEKFDDVSYLDGSRDERIRNNQGVISPSETLATLRGFKSSIETLRRDGKKNIGKYVEQEKYVEGNYAVVDADSSIISLNSSTAQ